MPFEWRCADTVRVDQRDHAIVTTVSNQQMLALLEPRLNEFHWCTMGLDQYYEPDYMTSADSNGLQALIDYCQQKGRICPQPTQWNELYALLPDKRRIGVGW